MMPCGSPMRVLVIDDDPFVRSVLVRQLQELGCHEVLTCDDGAAAVRLLETGPDSVDLIFSDLQMPGMDGFEFLRRLTGTGYAGGLVLISGENERVLKADRRLSPPVHLRRFAVLAKPIRPEQLRQLLSDESGVHSAAAYESDDAARLTVEARAD